MYNYSEWKYSSNTNWLIISTNRLINNRLRVVSNNCGFPRWCAINRYPAHHGYTFRSRGTLELTLPKAAVCPIKSAAGIVSIWTPQYDSYIFSARWLQRWPVRVVVHPVRIWPTQHAVKWRAASNLYKIINTRCDRKVSGLRFEK